jgi:hypothetical protein
LLAGVGYAGVKLAPKFAKLGDDALKLSDDVAKKFDEAFEKTKGKLDALANKVDDALSPGMVTTEGIVIKPKQINIKPTIDKTTIEKMQEPLEIRGRGGYETNQVTDKLGTKIPKVTQPEQITPSMKPNQLNKPLGEAEKIRPNAGTEGIRGITRQNEAAEVLWVSTLEE